MTSFRSTSQCISQRDKTIHLCRRPPALEALVEEKPPQEEQDEEDEEDEKFLAELAEYAFAHFIFASEAHSDYATVS